MTAPLDVAAHLHDEITASDPWRLESNPYEQRRFDAMVAMIQRWGRPSRALEVGCAAGVFTERLAPLCDHLHVIDVMPQALRKAAERVKAHTHLTWEAACVTEPFAAGRTFDLIVVSEVLCYLPDQAALRSAVEALAGRLAPGGLLIFGSAVDETCRRWGLFGGAETTMAEWDRLLTPTSRVAIQGRDWGENCEIVAYAWPDPEGREGPTSPPALAPQEHRLVPYRAERTVPAQAVLVLAPHPDDETLGCGGAIVRHVGAGVPVRVIVATDGAWGAAGEQRERLAERRREECRRAGQVLGYGEPVFWGLPDQSLAYGEALVERIMGEIGPADLVYAPSPQEMHPDHRALALAATEALRRRGGDVRLAFYEVGTPLHPNTLLDITDVASAKQQAIQCYASQLALHAYDEHIAALNRYRTYTLPAEVKAAEAYAIVVADDLDVDPLQLFRSEHDRQAAMGFAMATADFPLVTVIVRSIDRRELSDALSSIALQTYSNIEVVVVAARAGHRRLAERCGRFRLRLLDTDAPLGRSAAGNAGLEQARGDLILFLDDDDLLMPDHIARLVRALAKSPDARAAYAGVRVEGHHGVIDTYDDGVSAPQLLAWNRLPIHAVLFQRSLVEEGARFDEALEIYEDWDFWLQLSTRCEFVRQAGVSAIYRAHLGHSRAGTFDEGAQRDVRLRVWEKWLAATTPRQFERLVTEFKAAKAQAAAVEEMRLALADKERELLEREAAIFALRRSSSWRLTAPLRGLIALARGTARRANSRA